MAERTLFEKIEAYFLQEKELNGDITYPDMGLLEKIKQTADRPQSAQQAGPSVSEIVRMKIPVSVAADWHEARAMDELLEKICKCKECPLGKTRTSFVFGSGNPDADIMIIGEAPGADEDKQGLPFVGRAGQLLTKILESINLSREEVYIANIIKCRPPNNRRPEKAEVEECEPYLQKQIELIRPRFILALGLTAIDTLMKQRHKMGETRGRILNYHGIDTLVTYHPAALLRNPGWKKLVWEDVRNLRAMYDKYLKSK
ncbi:MAG: uracil-DNA glycosylase [Candidatus Kapaibacterium sp.]